MAGVHASGARRWTDGVLGKELRALAPFTLLLVVVQALIWIGLTRASVHLDSSAAASFRSGVLVFAAALYGALFFGLEPPSVRSFLLQLPVPRGMLLAAKAGAAAFHLVLFWVLSEGLSRILDPSPEAPRGWTVRLLLVLLTYELCALLSTFSREALTALVGGFLLLALGSGVLVGRVSDGTGMAWGILVVGAMAWGLWRRVTTLEDHPDGSAGARLLESAGGLRPHLLAVEWRQKRAVMLLLLALPLLSAALSWRGSAPFVVFLWAPLAGAVLGVLLFTEPERDGTGFFLHHLPIPRRTLVLQRLVSGLLFGGVLFLEFFGILWLHMYQHEVRYPPSPDLGLGPFVYQFGLLFLVAFGLGKMLSPWVSSSLLGVVLAILTLLTLVLVPGLFGLDEIAFGWNGALLVAVYGLAWWSTVHSRALEPAAGKNLRALWLLLPFWVLSVASLVGSGG